MKVGVRVLLPLASLDSTTRKYCVEVARPVRVIVWVWVRVVFSRNAVEDAFTSRVPDVL